MTAFVIVQFNDERPKWGAKPTFASTTHDGPNWGGYRPANFISLHPKPAVLHVTKLLAHASLFLSIMRSVEAKVRQIEKSVIRLPGLTFQK